MTGFKKDRPAKIYRVLLSFLFFVCIYVEN